MRRWPKPPRWKRSRRRELRRTHVFTHIRWEMVCYHIRCRCAPPRFVWASPAELRETYALPTAFRIFLEGEIEKE